MTSLVSFRFPFSPARCITTLPLLASALLALSFLYLIQRSLRNRLSFSSFEGSLLPLVWRRSDARRPGHDLIISVCEPCYVLRCIEYPKIMISHAFSSTSRSTLIIILSNPLCNALNTLCSPASVQLITCATARHDARDSASTTFSSLLTSRSSSGSVTS